MDEPVTSDGIRSGVNWMRVNSMPSVLANERASERLGEAREVLEQDVAVREEPEQGELERVALADDRPLDLVEHPAGELPEAFELHQCPFQ